VTNTRQKNNLNYIKKKEEQPDSQKDDYLVCRLIVCGNYSLYIYIYIYIYI
jgi:hypothetical protein